MSPHEQESYKPYARNEHRWHGKAQMSERKDMDVLLSGAGVMSATLGAWLQELEPDWTIEMVERLAGKSCKVQHLPETVAGMRKVIARVRRRVAWIDTAEQHVEAGCNNIGNVVLAHAASLSLVRRFNAWRLFALLTQPPTRFAPEDAA